MRTMVAIRTRGGHLVQAMLPEVVEALERLNADHAVLDGELVVLDEDGRCDFDAACARLKSPRGPAATVFVFDLLAFEAEDLRGRPLRERRRLLERILPPGDRVLQRVPSRTRTPSWMP